MFLQWENLQYLSTNMILEGISWKSTQLISEIFGQISDSLISIPIINNGYLI